MIHSKGLKREAAEGNFKVLFQNLPGRKRQSVFASGFKPRTP